MKNKPDSIAVFTHLPKTAGTSLNQLIFSEYNFDDIFIYKVKDNLMQKIESVLQDEKRNIKFNSGHITFGIHQHLKVPCNYFTILRDPIKRTISHFYFLQKKFSCTLPWEEFCRTRSNIMTKYLSGIEFEKISKAKSYSDYIKSLQFSFENYSNEILDKAKENLQHYAVIGLTDRFDETILLLNKFLGWKFRFYEKRNIGQKPKEVLSPEIMKCIEKYNELDIELYKYAKDIFQKQLAEQDSFFFKELELFKNKNNSLYAKVSVKKENAYVLLRRILHRAKREIQGQ